MRPTSFFDDHYARPAKLAKLERAKFVCRRVGSTTGMKDGFS
jgi:hypothetical protein